MLSDIMWCEHFSAKKLIIESDKIPVYDRS
nr:MAG TPA: hypothetical protein [Caudoviricetes sp.]